MKKLVLLCIALFLQSICFAQFTSTKTLSVGDTIPTVTLTSIEEKEVVIPSDFQQQPLVLVFYRANWCPFCNQHLADLQSYFKPLMKAGYKLIAISTESVENLKTTKENNFLKYTLLSDPSRIAISKYGIVNGAVAVPSVFITDKNGVIRYLYTNTDYKIRLSGEEIYNKAIEALK